MNLGAILPETIQASPGEAGIIFHEWVHVLSLVHEHSVHISFYIMHAILSLLSAGHPTGGSGQAGGRVFFLSNALGLPVPTVDKQIIDVYNKTSLTKHYSIGLLSECCPPSLRLCL